MVIYKQNKDYYISTGTPKSIAKCIRHERYVVSKAHKLSVPYYDNLFIVGEQVDLQRVAMRTALKRMKEADPKRYIILYKFYFKERISVKEYAKMNGISFQAMYRKLDNCRSILRKLSYEELKKLL